VPITDSLGNGIAGDEQQNSSNEQQKFLHNPPFPVSNFIVPPVFRQTRSQRLR
jgi:hypothetical protein